MSRFTHQMASYWKQLGAVIRNEFQTIFKDGGAMLILIFALIGVLIVCVIYALTGNTGQLVLLARVKGGECV